jgi:hypothetical protein
MNISRQKFFSLMHIAEGILEAVNFQMQIVQKKKMFFVGFSTCLDKFFIDCRTRSKALRDLKMV